jgi:hypothetical protein
MLVTYDIKDLYVITHITETLHITEFFLITSRTHN